MADDNKKKEAVIVDGITLSDLSRDDLEVFCAKLKNKLIEERKLRNVFQTERDNVTTMWDVSKAEIEEMRAKIRHVLYQDDTMVSDAVKTTDFQERMTKYYLFDHVDNINNARTSHNVDLQNLFEEHLNKQSKILGDLRDLRMAIKNQKLASLEDLKKTRSYQAEEYKKESQIYDNKIQEITKSEETRFKTMMKNLELSRRVELAQIEEQKKNHIDNLIKQHNKTINEYKEYCNINTFNNVGLINGTQREVEAFVKDSASTHARINVLRREKKKMLDPLHKTSELLVVYKRKASLAHRNHVSVVSHYKYLENVTNLIEKTKDQYNKLDSKYYDAKKDKDEMSESLQRMMKVLRKTLTVANKRS